MSVNLLTLASSSALNISSSSSHPTPSIVMPDKVWYFTADQLANSPSRRHGIDVDQELSYRQMTAYLIQEMGQRLQVSQLCINTAIVYMHRFYAFHSFTHFHRNGIAAASLFLAAKVEEQPRKLEHVIKAANKCLNQPTSSTTDAYYLEQAQDLVFNENVLLQTLGFDVAIDHPHTHVVKTCHLVKACKDLAQTSYFLASNSLHLTSMCLQYRPTVVACFCIYLACKWSRWEIPQSTEGKHWFHYVDKTVTMDLLKQLTDEFIAIYEKSPARLKSKLNSIKALAQGASNRVVNSKDKKATPEEWKMVDMMKMYHSSINTNEPNNASAISNSFPTIAEQQHQSSQGGQASLLPPPSQHAHQQQIRRPESHSSQHRSHHSSSASHHHSSKQSFATNDASDHKATASHKQPHYNSSASSRSRDYSQSSQNLNALSILPPSASNAAGGSRSSLSAANSNNSGRPSMPSGVASQKLTSSQAHDASFHKSARDRSSLPAALNAASVLSAQPHKQLTQKPDPGRLALKEHLGRGIAEQQSKPSNSKLFVPANGPQTGQANQLQSGAEMSRNAMQQQLQQRIPPPPGYHQSTMSRSSTNNNKHDQSVSSVQMQSQQPQPQQHKQIASLLENQFGVVSAEQMQSQPLHTAAASLSYSDSRTAAADARHSSSDQMETDLSQTYSPFLPMHAFKYQQSQQPQGQGQSQGQGQTKISMFSPEWNEKMPQQLSAGGSNMKPSTTPASLNYIKAANSFDSPKKMERERSLGTPTKKERNRLSYTGIDVSARPNSQSQKMQMQKKLDTVDNNSNVLAGTSAGAYSSSVKRPNESAQIKLEDDLIRDTKIRKIEPPSSSMTQSYADARSAIDTTSKLQVVNGIETNPDLVRNLLKESLCTTNALIKTEPPSTSIFHPASHQQSHESANMLIKEEKHANPALDIDESVSGKSEKKKKKDKHKHKEKDKDKSKDREERKKHKKDKDRHKERGESDRDSEPVKIKISKEKLETSANISGEPLGFKIKIPKERITGDLNSGAGNAINYGNIAADNSSTSSSCAPPALKIKISKDKLENYSSGSSDSAANTAAFNNLHNQNVASSNNPHSSNVLFSSSSGSGSGSSSNNKKKDRERDREREKEKKRSSFEYMKANANGSGTTTLGGGGASSLIQSSTSSSKNSSSSSKIQHYNNNTLSQLFGESNDDDDDDDDKTYQRPKKTSLLKTAVGSASSYSSATQNYTFSSKPSTEMGGNSDGVFNMQQQQQQHHHHHQQQYHPHQSLTNPQRQIYQKK